MFKMQPWDRVLSDMYLINMYEFNFSITLFFFVTAFLICHNASLTIT